MEEKRDYSLLRPFDLKAAKAGEAICFADGTIGIAKIIDGPDNLGSVSGWHKAGNLGLWNTAILRLSPLAWVEGKPVYKGDVLYLPDGGKCIAHKDTIEWPKGNHKTWSYIETDKLTWTLPKVKREGWGVMRVGRAQKTREEAEAVLKQYDGMCALSDLMEGELRVVRIEWEE